MTHPKRGVSPLLPRGDPGEEWAERALAPLRRVRIDLDVAPAVMARVAAARDRVPLPALVLRPRLVWISCVTAGAAIFIALAWSFVSAARGGEGVRQARALGASLGHLGTLLWGALVRVGAGLETVIVPLLRASGALLDAAAPLLRGVGVATAAAGLLSILVSIYVFANARATAPQSGGPGGAFPHGGTR